MPTYWLSDMQKFGVAFCVGGAFFISAGILFFFDRAMLAMGNILILLGTSLLLGPQSFLLYALQPSKRRGALAFTVGVTLILLRWTLVGFAVELYGAGILLSDALGFGAAWAGYIPIIGPYASQALDWLRRTFGGARNSELPV